MTSMMIPANPLPIGFDELERIIERSGRSGADGYPPYNIERIAVRSESQVDPEFADPETIRITLAVAGFTRPDLDIKLEDRRLSIRGKQADESERTYIYRGIARRQFCRTFLLADGLEVRSACLDNGLLAIDLVRLVPVKTVRTIAIRGEGSGP